jgi:hypothetical protein
MSDNFGSFKWLTGDVNYTDHGGKWYRKVGPRNYHVIELMNWRDVTGYEDDWRKPIPEADKPPMYNVDLSEVDVGALAETKQNGEVPLVNALKSCGYEISEHGNIIQTYDQDFIARPDGAGAERFNLVCLEALHGHGNRARLADLYGNNWRKLMREAISTSRELDPKKNPEEHEAAMNEPANMIGTTQRNMMLGIIFTRDQ